MNDLRSFLSVLAVDNVSERRTGVGIVIIGGNSDFCAFPQYVLFSAFLSFAFPGINTNKIT